MVGAEREDTGSGWFACVCLESPNAKPTRRKATSSANRKARIPGSDRGRSADRVWGGKAHGTACLAQKKTQFVYQCRSFKRQDARSPGRMVRIVRRTPRRRPGTLKLKHLDRAASPGKIPIQLLWRFLLLLGVPGVLAFHPLGSRRLSAKLRLK